MEEEIEQKIIRILYAQNKWWITGRVPSNLKKDFKRRDFYVIRKKIKNGDKILALMGPRQVGKTTLIYQIIDDLLTDVDPARILYLSFDYPYMLTISKTPINDILNIYSTRILKESLAELKDKIFIFFDEICKVEGWSRILKGWYDLKYPIKFMITDSSASNILKGSSESLVGRIDLQIMLSIKFADFIEYHLKLSKIKDLSLNMREYFVMAIKSHKGHIFYEYLKDIFAALAPYEDKIRIFLQNYLIKNGYPETLDENSFPVCAEKLKNYLYLTLYKDIFRLFEVRNPRVLEELSILLADSTSQLIEYSGLANTLSIKKDTLLNYISYLESAFLISTSEFYTKSRATRIRKAKKLYFINNGLRNALLDRLDENLLDDLSEMGKVVETIVYDHSKRLKYCLEPTPYTKLFYWKDKQGYEVDIIMELFNTPIPIEVKYKNKLRETDLRGIRRFLSQYRSPFGIVVTKNLLSMENNIILIPLWLFLLMC